MAISYLKLVLISWAKLEDGRREKGLGRIVGV
jgi:hypothetical protein